MKRILSPALASLCSPAILRSPEDETGSAVAVVVATATAPLDNSCRKSSGRIPMETINEIRNLRAQSYPEGHERAGSPVYSHKALGAKFGASPGAISHIVRNKTYRDPDYVPVHDNH